MTISINQITSGLGLLINGDVHIVEEYHHVKPGKGSAFVRVKLRNLKTGLINEKTFKSSEKLEDVFLEEKVLQFLYRAGDSFHFMDQTTFEEQILDKLVLEEAVPYLKENSEVRGVFFESRVMKIDLPMFISAQIAQTEPGIKGDSARAGTKPAVIDSGASVQVPLFVNQGDWIKIDTRTGQYVERLQK